MPLSRGGGGRDSNSDELIVIMPSTFNTVLYLFIPSVFSYTTQQYTKTVLAKANILMLCGGIDSSLKK